MNAPTAFPLSWPAGRPRAARRQRAGIARSGGLSRAVSDLRDVLELFSADTRLPVTRLVISSNVTLDETKPEDTGVAVWFEWDGALRCIAMDELDRVEGNLRAVYLFIERCRADFREGGLPLLREVLSGFQVSAPCLAGGGEAP